MSLKANAASTIATVGGIDADDTSFTLTTGAFDTKSSGDKIALVIDPDNSAKMEVVKCYVSGTAVSSITRAQDGTSAAAHSAGASVVLAAVPSNFEYFINNDYVGNVWTAYTTTWGNSGTANTLGAGTKTAFYTKIGKTIHFRIDLTWAADTVSGNGNWSFTLPVATKTGYTRSDIMGVGNAFDTAPADYGIVARWQTTTIIDPACFNVAGTYLLQAGVTTAAPFTWATGDTFTLQGTYECA